MPPDIIRIQAVDGLHIGYGHENIAGLISEVDPSTPFTILAFFPQYRMTEYRSPSAPEMVKAYTRVKEKGLEAVRLGNVGVFASTERDLEYLMQNVERKSF